MTLGNMREHRPPTKGKTKPAIHGGLKLVPNRLGGWGAAIE
jgi:hypothetical protein